MTNEEIDSIFKLARFCLFPSGKGETVFAYEKAKKGTKNITFHRSKLLRILNDGSERFLDKRCFPRLAS